MADKRTIAFITMILGAVCAYVSGIMFFLSIPWIVCCIIITTAVLVLAIFAIKGNKKGDRNFVMASGIVSLLWGVGLVIAAIILSMAASAVCHTSHRWGGYWYTGRSSSSGLTHEGICALFSVGCICCWAACVSWVVCGVFQLLIYKDM